jgi:hypothetical protein
MSAFPLGHVARPPFSPRSGPPDEVFGTHTVTYTGYAWVVLTAIDQWGQPWVALALLLLLSYAMVSTWIRIRRTQTRHDAP